MGSKFRFEMNDAMRERMDAGLAFMYTTRDDIEAFKPRCEEIRSHGGGYIANFAGDGLELVIY